MFVAIYPSKLLKSHSLSSGIVSYSTVFLNGFATERTSTNVSVSLKVNLGIGLGSGLVVWFGIFFLDLEEVEI